jgi:hypothetical protein
MIRLAPASLLLASALLLPCLAAAQETARGLVFEDLNDNGQHDPGEPGIPNVRVSNQRDVVLTDSGGRYEIRLDEVADQFIFVTKPTGYEVPRNDNNLPRFFHWHKPAGSPQLYYPGTEPTGPLPEAINFPLTRKDEPTRFKVIAYADVQPETGQELGYFIEKFLPEVIGTDAAFVTQLGDNMFDNLGIYPTMNRAMGRIGVPIRNIYGNHDMNFDAKEHVDADDHFNSLFGPSHYSFEVGGVHFVALNTVYWQGDEYRGEIDPRQLEWLANDMQHVPEDALVVLLMHIPLRRGDENVIIGVDKLMEILNGRERVLALSGHWHRNLYERFGSDEGWTGPGVFHHLVAVTASGAWWSGMKDAMGIPTADQSDGTPHGYTIIDFDGNDFTFRYKSPGKPDDYQMRIFAPSEITSTVAGKQQIVANVFYSCDQSTVELSLDGGDWIPMTREPRHDPWIDKQYTGYGRTSKSWAGSAKSPNMWTATLDEDLRNGRYYTVTVRFTDSFGQVWKNSRIFSHR